MKRRTTSETLELTSYDNDGPLNPTITRASYSDGYWSSYKVWFQHVVLRSGSHYEELGTHLDQQPVNPLTQGWRSGSRMCCTLVGLCLAFNVIFTTVVIVRFPPSDGIGDFGIETCDSVLSATSKIHAGINILATILVAASNYNMQCLSAPSRRDIDVVHQRRLWLDIGIHSVRNLRFVPWWKVVLWFSLLISTLPLHLLWNSAVFSTTTSNTYAAIVVSQDFLNSTDIYGGLDCTDYEKYQQSDQESYATCWTLEKANSTTNSLKTLNPEDCMRRYPNKLESDGFNLIAVVKGNPPSNSSSFPPAKASLPVLAYFESITFANELGTYCRGLCDEWCDPQYNCTSYCNATTDAKGNPYNASKVSRSCYDFASNRTSWEPGSATDGSDWICSSNYVLENGCTTQEALQNSSDWKILPDYYEIDHCLSSDSALMQCRLQYSSVILYSVVACNTIKFLAILLHLLYAKEPIMATVGDAVASFLRHPDPATSGKCLFTKHTSEADIYGSLIQWEGTHGEHLKPLKWERSAEWRERWSHGVSLKHFFFGTLL